MSTNKFSKKFNRILHFDKKLQKSLVEFYMSTKNCQKFTGICMSTKNYKKFYWNSTNRKKYKYYSDKIIKKF
jgi:hypothetical protein